MSTVYNPGKSPVRIDDEGRVLGGGERTDVASSDWVAALIEKGLLVEVEAGGKPAKTKEG